MDIAVKAYAHHTNIATVRICVTKKTSTQFAVNVK